MEISRTLAENTARLHGASDLAGGLARDLVETRAALQAAVEVIRTWHNMPHAGKAQGPGFDQMMDQAWEIYKRNAPEMRPIMRALDYKGAL